MWNPTLDQCGPAWWRVLKYAKLLAVIEQSIQRKVGACGGLINCFLPILQHATSQNTRQGATQPANVGGYVARLSLCISVVGTKPLREPTQAASVQCGNSFTPSQCLIHNSLGTTTSGACPSARETTLPCLHAQGCSPCCTFTEDPISLPQSIAHEVSNVVEHRPPPVPHEITLIHCKHTWDTWDTQQAKQPS